MAVQVNTAVFHRMVLEVKQAGFQAGFREGYQSAKEVGVRALAENAAETYRFGSFSKEYLKEVARSLWEYFAKNPDAKSTNQVLK